jgi:preprotein translocase subunit YajC
MANRRRRRREDSGVSRVLYVLLVLVLLVGMGCLFYYSRSQSKEHQEYIEKLESKEAGTKTFVTQVEETEEETETGTESESDTELESETESISEAEIETGGDTESVSEAETESGAKREGLSEGEAEAQAAESSAENKVMAETDTQSEAGKEIVNIMILNGTGKSGVAAYWKRFLSAKGYAHIVMADYKEEVEAQTVVYLKNGGDAPEAFYSCFPTLKVQDGELALSDKIEVAAGQDEYDSYDAWIVVGKDDALHD